MSRSMLDQVRERLGDPPRSFGFFRKRSLMARKPEWMPADDLLSQILSDQSRLLVEGSVTWAALVQANSQMFKPGMSDCPAYVVHARDDAFDDQVDKLIQIAQRLYRLKNTTPDDPEERRLAALITDELTRTFRRPVPKSCSWGRQVFTSDILVFRKHLPRGYLANGWFPLLHHPDLNSVMIVPSAFWPEPLVDAWA